MVVKIQRNAEGRGGRVSVLCKARESSSTPSHFGRVLALARFHMNNSLPFERTTEQTTGAMPPAHNNSDCYTRDPFELQAYESYYTTELLHVTET